MSATYTYKLHDLAEGTTEAEITAWHVSVGDRVVEDQPLLDVATEKATVELPSPVAGVVISVHASVGERVAVGSTLAMLELVSTSSSMAECEEQGGSAVRTENAGDQSSDPGPVISTLPPQGKPKAAPAVRRHAEKAGVDLQKIQGTGPEGRIRHEDIEAAAKAASSTPDASGTVTPRGPTTSPSSSSIEEVRLSIVRRAIAQRMSEAKRRIPHFSYIEEVDMTELERLRAELNAESTEAQGKAGKARVSLTPIPFLVRALAGLLPAFPDFNATFDDEAQILHRHKAVHIGIATHTPKGLLVPVVRSVESRTLFSCAEELARMGALARTGRANLQDLSGSTITISSLGALGGIAVTPIINWPEVAIVAPNRITERAVVRGGEILVRKMMNLSASFDHRIIDGYVAANFVQRLKEQLERPLVLVTDGDALVRGQREGV